MTEQEIINILKENKNKGIAYMFLPEDTQDWIHDNFGNSNLLYLDEMGKWQYFKYADLVDYDNVIFALPDMFDLPPKPQTGWVEFEIKSGVFDYDDRVFDWWDWGCFLNYCKGCNIDNFTAFGGWQYHGDSGWYTTPCIKQCNKDSFWHYIDGEAKPAIPVKIRFWRESR